MVSRGRCGCQRAGRTVLEGAGAAHRAAHRRIGGGGDLVAVQLEVGDIAALVSNLEAVGRARAHLVFVQRPVHKVIARGRCGCQRAGRTVLVGAGARHAAAVGGVDAGRDLVACSIRRNEEHRVAPVGDGFTANTQNTSCIPGERGQASEGVLGILNREGVSKNDIVFSQQNIVNGEIVAFGIHRSVLAIRPSESVFS